MKVRANLSPIVRIVDDDDRVRESVSFILRLAGFQTMEFASAQEFLDRDDAERPGCLILDIRMPGMSGLELQNELRKQQRTLPILFLTGHGDVSTAVMALTHGAADFVTKPMDPEKLSAKVERLVEWHMGIAEKLAEKGRYSQLFEELTDKEKQVCRAVAEGDSNKEIAEKLGISEPTVKSHRARLSSKLECRSAVKLAEFLHIVDEPVEVVFPISRNLAQ